LLLLLAAEPSSDQTVLWRAAGELGITAEAVEAAEAEGLVTTAPTLSLQSPVVRSVVYSRASGAERRCIHRLLADATDPDLEPDRLACHRAAASLEPDEQAACEHERLANQARASGDYARAGALLARAAVLTPGKERRAQRSLAAAEAELAAGAGARASARVAEASSEFTEAKGRYRALRLRVVIDREMMGAAGPADLLEAGQRLESLDARLAREAYLEALMAAIAAGEFCANGSVIEAVRVAQMAPSMPESQAAGAMCSSTEWSSSSRRAPQPLPRFFVARSP
jgi:hypothetical protein